MSFEVDLYKSTMIRFVRSFLSSAGSTSMGASISTKLRHILKGRSIFKVALGIAMLTCKRREKILE